MPNFTNGEWDFIEYPMNNNKEKWCLVGSTEKAIGFIRHKADARLIAAAPELYDIVHTLAECQPHQFSALKMRAGELLNNLQEDTHE